jgi:hypothetical protein
MATTSSGRTCRNDECWKLEFVIEWRVKNRSTNLTLLTCRNDELLLEAENCDSMARKEWMDWACFQKKTHFLIVSSNQAQPLCLP